MTKNVDRKTRREQLLAAALKLAHKHGYANLTKPMISEATGLAATNLNAHFGTMVQFRRDLMRHAVKIGDAVVVMQGLACNDPHAKKASTELRAAAVAAMS